MWLARLVEEAVFNAKLRRYMRPPVKVDELYFYFINDIGRTDLVVDVTDHYAVKEQALSCYRSQFQRLKKMQSLPADRGVHRACAGQGFTAWSAQAYSLCRRFRL